MCGHKRGLYRALAHAGSVTSTELAGQSGLAERYVRQWANNRMAGGYLVYDRDRDRQCYTLPDAYVPVLADPDSPVLRHGCAGSSNMGDRPHGRIRPDRQQ